VHFNLDVCFGEYACYTPELKDVIDVYIGRVLDFSDVTLLNNDAEYTYM
jgi:hypothetical protein